jgi:hypothetical protein
VILSSVLALTLTIAAESVPVERVYVARLRGGEGVEASAAAALEEAVLVAAKRARPDLTVIGRGDVAMLADLRAEQEAAGCDAESCAAEIADALGAPQIITGKLSHVGSMWILSLTRLERGSLLVLARDSVEKQGASAEVLVGEVSQLVARVFADEGGITGDDIEAAGADGVSALAAIGGVGLGAGVVALAGGGALVAYSLALFNDAQRAFDRGDAAEIERARALGEPMGLAGWVLLGAGATTALVGGIALAIGLGE